MIDFEGYYTVAVEQIEYIDMNEKGTGDCPYCLNIHLLSGRVLSVCYRTAMARTTARNKLCGQIETERRRDSETIINRLYLIKDALERVDKRQFRIWKQLKELLKLEPDETI